MVDVGTGLCVVAVAPNGHAMLYDAGSAKVRLSRSTLSSAGLDGAPTYRRTQKAAVFATEPSGIFFWHSILYPLLSISPPTIEPAVTVIMLN